LGANDSRRSFPRFQRQNQEANAQLVATLDALALRKGISSAQLGLAWLYARARQLDVALVPIPGTRRPARLSENVGAASVSLTDDELAAIAPLAEAVKGAAV